MVSVSDLGLTSSDQLACDAICVLCHNDTQPLNFVQKPGGKYTCIYHIYIYCYSAKFSRHTIFRRSCNLKRLCIHVHVVSVQCQFFVFPNFFFPSQVKLC